MTDFLMLPAPLASLPPEIQVLYGLFAPRRLKKTDLRSIPWDALAEWMQETPIYVGGDDEFKELLPRFFELAWEEARAGRNLDMFPPHPFRVLLSCQEHEIKAVEVCFVLLWRLALVNENALEMSDILWILQYAEIPWLPFLEVWLNSSVSTSVLADAISSSLSENTTPDVRQWLSQQAVTERIEADFFAVQHSEQRTDISKFEQTIAFYCAH